MKRKAPPATGQPPQSSALERLAPLLNEGQLQQLLAELERPLWPSFRLNPLKNDPEMVEEWARRYGWELQPVPYCSLGWWVRSSQTPLSQSIEHRLGQYYIQDAASMLPVELFDWEGLDDALVLDLAASPGGKTTHLSAKMGDRGLVMANDASQSRITALRLVLQNWGALHSAVTNYPGEKLGMWFPGKFDRVLLDAPCSMQGLRSTDSHPMRAVTAKERSSLADRQLRLLESALTATRPGGQVVYSTCTLEPQEDEGVLDRFLRRNPGLARIDDVTARLLVPAPGLEQAYGEVFDTQVKSAARLWPHIYGTSGFFAARLTKLEESASPPRPAPARPLSRAGYDPLTRKQTDELGLFFQDTYHLDLLQLLDAHQMELWRRGKSVHAFPLSFLNHFAELPVQGLGLAVGEDGPDGFIISQDWVARFGEKFQAGRWTVPDEHLAAWLRGEDLPGEISGRPAAPVVIVFDEGGRLLGRARSAGGRIKNLMPRRFL